MSFPIKINPKEEGINRKKTILIPKETVFFSSFFFPLAARKDKRGKIAVEIAIEKIPRGN